MASAVRFWKGVFELRVDVITIFPSLFESPLKYGTLRIAQEKGLLEVRLHDLRDYTRDKHRQVDDTPYGGGAGMVMKPEPFFEAVLDIAMQDLEKFKREASIILLTPQGQPLVQEKVEELSHRPRLLLLCGRYEGIDERVRKHLITEEISIGDYVVSGGELPALVVIEAIARYIPGVLGDNYSKEEETFSQVLLEYPQYTRPAEYKGFKVPEVLLSGNHAEIEKWRKRQSLERTLQKRPELIKECELSSEYKELYQKLKES